MSRHHPLSGFVRAANRDAGRAHHAAVALALSFTLALATIADAAQAADMSKTIRVAQSVAESGFDPQAISDAYSFDVCRAIFEPLYTYDYFARPARLIPNTADGMPQITDGGRTYTVKVRRGIYFASDPAFNGKKRELTAEDYVYTIKRIFDPKIRSYWLYVYDHRLVGLDEGLATARKSGRFDYDAKIEGLQTLDRYTVRIRFKDPNYTFKYWLADTSTAAVAREVIEAHADASNRAMENPVGTGAYRLKDWVRGQKIVLEANPDYRDDTYPVPGEGSAAGDVAIAKANAGKKIPIVGRIEMNVLEEDQPRMLAFDSGQLDYVELPRALADNVLTGDALKPEYVKRRINLQREIEPSLSFFFFNMDDPVVGGYAPVKIALRRAIILAYDRRAEIEVLRHGQAEPASQLVPPGLAGHDPKIVARNAYDPAAARALLDKFGYKDRDGDGYRETPDGKPLLITKATTPTAIDRVDDELWKKSMDAIGIHMTFFTQKWPELNKMSEAGQLQMWGLSWISTSPDGEPFVSPLFSKNVGTSNDARFRLPEYDRAYEASLNLPDGAERTAEFGEMTTYVLNYAPWLIDLNVYVSVISQPWLKGYKQHPFIRHQWKYYDVDRHP